MAKECRLEILKGNDAGAQFRITGNRVVFGRTSDSDIVVADPSVSRNHAELIKTEDGYLIRDLKSSNGVFVNGKKIDEHFLISSDVFTIGNHAYRYIEVEAVSGGISAQERMEGTIPGISISSSGEIVVPGAGGAGNAKKKRLIFYGIVFGVFLLLGGAAFYLLLGDTKTPPKKTDQKTATSTQTTQTSGEDANKEDTEEPKYATKIPDDMREFYDKATEYYFEGKRELRMENYARAIESFKKSVTFYPNYAKSNYYIKIISEKIKGKSEQQLKVGKKMLEQYRYDDAIRSFTEVMNLNAREPNSNSYKEAEKYIKIAEKRKGTVIDQ